MSLRDISTARYIQRFNPVAHELLLNHVSPIEEFSVAKGIPVTLENMAILRSLGKQTGIRLRYRGTRTQWNAAQRRSYCLQKDAVTVAVYCR